jgi:hypothetical protein
LFKQKGVEKVEYANLFPALSAFNLIKTKIPQWYKDSDFFFPAEKLVGRKNIEWDNKGLKTCVPMLDSFTTGYCFELSIDIFVGLDINKNPYITWKEGFPSPVSERKNDPNDKIPTPSGHYPVHFIWHPQSIFRLPAGYSALITNPLNRFDLPFTTMSGIVDADGIMHKGNIPFFIKDGFEGYIAKGTPIAQIIPFKRDSWKMEENTDILALGNNNNAMSNAVHYGWYKKNIWKKKSFE